MKKEQETVLEEIYKLIHARKRTAESHKRLERNIDYLVKDGVVVRELPKDGEYILYDILAHAASLRPGGYLKHKPDAVKCMDIVYEKYNKNVYLSEIHIENGKIVSEKSCYN